MSTLFVECRPVGSLIGVNPPSDLDRKPIWTVRNGDTIKFKTIPKLEDGTAATPDNSVLYFALMDQRFCDTPIWEGYWRDGIELQPDDTAVIRIPDAISECLRRGSFLFSLAISDKLGNDRYTAFEGSFLIEYAPTSPLHDIPYKG